MKNEVDFSKWFVYFADERCVSLDHNDSNYKACKEALFDFVRTSQFYRSSSAKRNVYVIE